MLRAGKERGDAMEKVRERMETQGKRKEGRRGENSKGRINVSKEECGRGKEGPGRGQNLHGAGSRLRRTLEGVVGACGAAYLEVNNFGGSR